MAIIKKMSIKNSTGSSFDSRDIGAEAQNIDVSYDEQGKIIEDITVPGVIVSETKGLSTALKNLDVDKSLSDLTDVNISNVTNNQGIIYNANTQKWENKNIESADTKMNIDGSNANSESVVIATKNFMTGAATSAVGEYSHAEGSGTCAYGDKSHAEGWETAAGWYAHAEGYQSTAYGEHEGQGAAHAEGIRTFAGYWSHAEGNSTYAGSGAAHAEGVSTSAWSGRSHAEGSHTQAMGNHSHAEGEETYAGGDNAHAEGYQTHTSENGAHAEGYQTQASGEYAHAEGYQTSASGKYSHTEGKNTRTDENGHAEGELSSAGWGGHAEGYNTGANGYCHAEGYNSKVSSEMFQGHNISSSSGAHAEGYSTSELDTPYWPTIGITARNYGSHAEGYSSSDVGLLAAVGIGSHAEGAGTKAYAKYSHVGGFKSQSDSFDSNNELGQFIHGYQLYPGTSYSDVGIKTLNSNDIRPGSIYKQPRTTAPGQDGLVIAEIGCKSSDQRTNEKYGCVSINEYGDIYTKGMRFKARGILVGTDTHNIYIPKGAIYWFIANSYSTSNGAYTGTESYLLTCPATMGHYNINIVNMGSSTESQRPLTITSGYDNEGPEDYSNSPYNQYSYIKIKGTSTDIKVGYAFIPIFTPFGDFITTI